MLYLIILDCRVTFYIQYAASFSLSHSPSLFLLIKSDLHKVLFLNYDSSINFSISTHLQNTTLNIKCDRLSNSGFNLLNRDRGFNANVSWKSSNHM